MYFIKRGDRYIDVAGHSFRDLMAGKLATLPGERATLSDWANHLTTTFPEVRLKRYLEVRGADCGPRRMLAALPAFWVGLLYDDAALDAAWEMTKEWTAEERQALRDEVPALALRASIRDRSVHEVARLPCYLGTGACPPRQARHRRPGRDPPSRAARRHRGARQDARRGSDRKIQGRMGRVGGTGVHRARLVMGGKP
jgi:glutamate--cysteine ligase